MTDGHGTCASFGNPSYFPYIVQVAAAVVERRADWNCGDLYNASDARTFECDNSGQCDAAKMIVYQNSGDD